MYNSPVGIWLACSKIQSLPSFPKPLPRLAPPSSPASFRSALPCLLRQLCWLPFCSLTHQIASFLRAFAGAVSGPEALALYLGVAGRFFPSSPASFTSSELSRVTLNPRRPLYGMSPCLHYLPFICYYLTFSPLSIY